MAKETAKNPRRRGQVLNPLPEPDTLARTAPASSRHGVGLLYARAQQVRQAILHWLQDREGPPHMAQIHTAEDAMRLTQLQVYSQRYGLDLNQTLELLLPVLRIQRTKQGRKPRPGVLGLNLAALCSASAERILREEIAAAGYPLVQLNREKERDAQLRRLQQLSHDGLPVRSHTVAIDAPESLRTFLSGYLGKAQHKRSQYLQQITRSRIRPYRTSPWL